MPIIAALYGGNLRLHHLPLAFIQALASKFVRRPLLEHVRRTNPANMGPVLAPSCGMNHISSLSAAPQVMEGDFRRAV